MSEYIRKRDHGICFTCGKKEPDYEDNDGNTKSGWKRMDAGHFIHKSCLDFNEININCQCSRCNRHLHGNAGEYAIRLIKKYGIGAVDNLKIEGNTVHKFNMGELEIIIDKYKKKIENLTNIF